MNLPSKQKQTHRRKEHTCGASGEGAKAMDQEFGMSRYKLVYREWLENNKLPLYSTQNYIQYPVINHKGKECM